MMYPTPLPVNPFRDPLLATAYEHCLALEKADVAEEPLSSVISARLLGHLLHQLHVTAGFGGASTVAEQINEAASSKDAVAEMQQLALGYMKNLIKPFYRASGPTPDPSEHSSRDSADPRVSWMQAMQEGKLDHRAAKNYALRRDNFRCAVTGSVDVVSVNDGLAVPAAGEQCEFLKAAHIIPESCNTNIGPDTDKKHPMGGVWGVLSCFAQDLDLPPSLQGNNIHRIDNIMSLTHTIHSSFDYLYLWLKPVHPPVPHRYQTFVHMPHIPGANRTFTFNHTAAHPAPNPTYLALHALACEVAHMSGAAGYIEQIHRDVGDGYLLAPDGSSARLLASALSLVEVQ